MSLEIIEYNTEKCSESELLTTIKQRTGLELEALDSGSYGIKTFNMRFPDMETAQSIKLQYLNISGTFFIDSDNHFLCYTLSTEKSNFTYVDNLYKAILFDCDGQLVNVVSSTSCDWKYIMNISMQSDIKYLENDSSRNNITLCPLRVYASGKQSFIKNCYVNYERRFSKCLKFIDENGNEYVSLGGYLLYRNDKEGE